MTDLSKFLECFVFIFHIMPNRTPALHNLKHEVLAMSQLFVFIILTKFYHQIYSTILTVLHVVIDLVHVLC